MRRETHGTSCWKKGSIAPVILSPVLTADRTGTNDMNELTADNPSENPPCALLSISLSSGLNRSGMPAVWLSKKSFSLFIIVRNACIRLLRLARDFKRVTVRGSSLHTRLSVSTAQGMSLLFVSYLYSSNCLVTLTSHRCSLESSPHDRLRTSASHH